MPDYPPPSDPPPGPHPDPSPFPLPEGDDKLPMDPDPKDPCRQSLASLA